METTETPERTVVRSSNGFEIRTPSRSSSKQLYVRRSGRIKQLDEPEFTTTGTLPLSSLLGKPSAELRSKRKPLRRSDIHQSLIHQPRLKLQIPQQLHGQEQLLQKRPRIKPTESPPPSSRGNTFTTAAKTPINWAKKPDSATHPSVKARQTTLQRWERHCIDGSYQKAMSTLSESYRKWQARRVAASLDGSSSEDDEEDQPEVERIIGAMKIEANVWYLIKYKEYDDTHNKWLESSALNKGRKAIALFIRKYGRVNGDRPKILSPEGADWVTSTRDRKTEFSNPLNKSL